MYIIYKEDNFAPLWIYPLFYALNLEKNKQMPQKFKTGDQVMLKSGGPKMTESIYQGSESTNVLCVWFAGEEVKTAYFHEDTIKNQAEGESGSPGMVFH